MTWDERMGVFSTNYRHERNVFFGNGSFFWQNMRIRAVIFSWKIRKKGHLIVFFGPSCIVEFWQKWSFLTKFGMKAGGFHKKFENMILKVCVFVRKDIFLTKYGHDNSVLFREWTIFLTKSGHESINFFVKNWK